MESSNKIPYEKVIQMSLDEYITQSGNYVSPYLNQLKPNQPEDMDLDSNTEDIKQENISENGDENIVDLRERIVGKPNNEHRNTNSQQWRLTQSKNRQEHNRPAGMPSLVPYVELRESINPNQRTNWANPRKNWVNPHNRGGRKGWSRRNYFHKTNNNDNYFNRNGRMQNNRNNNNNNMRRGGFQQLHGTAFQNDSETPTNIEIQYSKDTTSESQNCLLSIQESTPQRSASSNFGEAATALQSLRDVDLSNGIKLELMPLIASKILEQITIAGREKYNMKAQKEIHKIQGKPFLFNCPGGSVTSSDGPGIQNCKLTPKSTGLTMNHRFS